MVALIVSVILLVGVFLHLMRIMDKWARLKRFYWKALNATGRFLDWLAHIPQGNPKVGETTNRKKGGGFVKRFIKLARCVLATLFKNLERGGL